MFVAVNKFHAYALKQKRYKELPIVQTWFIGACVFRDLHVNSVPRVTTLFTTNYYLQDPVLILRTVPSFINILCLLYSDNHISASVKFLKLLNAAQGISL